MRSILPALGLPHMPGMILYLVSSDAHAFRMHSILSCHCRSALFPFRPWSLPTVLAPSLIVRASFLPFPLPCLLPCPSFVNLILSSIVFLLSFGSTSLVSLLRSFASFLSLESGRLPSPPRILTPLHHPRLIHLPLDSRRQTTTLSWLQGHSTMSPSGSAHALAETEGVCPGDSAHISSDSCYA